MTTYDCVMPVTPAIPSLTLDQIAANFESLDEWEDRFTYLIELGRKLPPMSEADKVEANRVYGCQATVYMKPTVDAAKRVQLSAWADAATVCGLIAILLTMYSGKAAAEIAPIDSEAYFRRLGLEEHLTQTRRNGLHSMIQRIHTIAKNVEHA